MDPFGNAWARDDEDESNHHHTVPSPPLRPLSSFQLSSPSDAWLTEVSASALHASTSSHATSSFPEASSSASAWSPTLARPAAAATRPDDDAPWASELDPDALPLPSMARLNLGQPEADDLSDERSQTRGARHAEDEDDDAQDSAWVAPTDSFGASTSSHTEFDYGDAPDQEKEEEQEEEEGWGKMDLPPLTSPDRVASPANDRPPSRDAQESEGWGEMDLPPLDDGQDKLPTWDGSAAGRAPREEDDAVDPWNADDTASREQARDSEPEEPSPEEISAILEKMRQVSEQAPPHTFGTAGQSSSLRASAESARSRSGPQDEPSASEPRPEASTQTRPVPATGSSSSFLGSIFKRKGQAAQPSADARTEEPPKQQQEPPPPPPQPTAPTSQPSSEGSQPPASGFSSFFSRARTSIDAPPARQSPKPSTDFARPSIPEISSRSPIGQDGAANAPQAEQPAGVRRFFSRFSRQAANPEEEDQQPQHVQPDHKVSNGAGHDEEDDENDGWLAKQEVRVLELAGVSTLPPPSRTSSAPGFGTHSTLSASQPASQAATHPKPKTEDVISFDAFFDAYEKKPARAPIASSSSSSRRATDALDPFAALVSTQPQKLQPQWNKPRQGISIKMHQPAPNRPSSVPMLPPPPSISRPASVQPGHSHKASGATTTPFSNGSNFSSNPPHPVSSSRPPQSQQMPPSNSMDDFGDFTSSPAPSPVVPRFSQQPLAPVRKTPQPLAQSQPVRPSQSPAPAPAAAAAASSSSASAQGKLSKADFDFFEGL